MRPITGKPRKTAKQRSEEVSKRRQELANLVLARRIQAKLNRELKFKPRPIRSKSLYKKNNAFNQETNLKYAKKLEQEFLNENYARQLTVHPEGYEESKMSEPPTRSPEYRNLTLGKVTSHRRKPSHLTRIHF